MDHIINIDDFMKEWKKQKGIEGNLTASEKEQIIKEYASYLQVVIPVVEG